MANDKTWLDLNLSEFVEQSLARNMIPFLQFVDKDNMEIGVSEPAISPKDKTPIQVLESEIRFFKSMQLRIETKAGLHIDPERKEEIEANLKKLHEDLGIKILEFKFAIEKLNQ